MPFSWYSEITAQYLRGEGENAEFKSPGPGDAVGIGHWKNLWDLTDALTMELGASYAAGNNSFQADTALKGADLTFKWRPTSGGKYKSWILGGEYMDRKLQQAVNTEESGLGWNAWGQYQFAERWSTVARYDQLKIDGSDSVINPNALANITTKKYSGAFVFNATEFSSYRAEYSVTNGPVSATGHTSENKIYLQANFTIGAHPSHSY